MNQGDFYLFACPWDWTFVGQYQKHVNGGLEIVIRHGGYFTRTGATFDVLTAQGLQPDSVFHARPDGAEMIIPAQGPKWPWTGPTPWVRP